MIDTNTYCSIIHGGLNINMKNNQVRIQPCCLLNDLKTTQTTKYIWKDVQLEKYRNYNKQNALSRECLKICKSIEQQGFDSMRTGMNRGLDISNRVDLSGPARIDLMFDISCNLACRTCGPASSTLWQKHLGLNDGKIVNYNSSQNVIEVLQNLDLSNLKMLVFSGGETLLGNNYWEIAKWLVDNVPDAKDNLTLCFQTNATQSIPKKYFPLIEKFRLVKLHYSIDGIDSQFEYLRWPAKWNQVKNNILNLKMSLPSNVMFLVETTISIFNLLYLAPLENWVKDNLSQNREGDPVIHSRHYAHGTFSLENLSQEYVDYLTHKNLEKCIPANWCENQDNINKMIKLIIQEDRNRGQDWNSIFPMVSNFYKRFL